MFISLYNDEAPIVYNFRGFLFAHVNLEIQYELTDSWFLFCQHFTQFLSVSASIPM
jgi:hypothetical protein